MDGLRDIAHVDATMTGKPVDVSQAATRYCQEARGKLTGPAEVVDYIEGWESRADGLVEEIFAHA